MLTLLAACLSPQANAATWYCDAGLNWSALSAPNPTIWTEFEWNVGDSFAILAIRHTTETRHGEDQKTSRDSSMIRQGSAGSLLATVVTGRPEPGLWRIEGKLTIYERIFSETPTHEDLGCRNLAYVGIYY
jgi:hypothetical protein